MNEIDLIIEDGGTLYPIEIKKHIGPQKNDIKAFNTLNKITNIKLGNGGIICLYENLLIILHIYLKRKQVRPISNT